MWFAIFITVLAAAGNNIGKVLQKQATRTLPKLTLRSDVVHAYLQSKTWVAGMLADLGGALLMIVAFAYAPVSVVQPVSGVGLVILLVFSHFYLKERLRPREWVAAGVAFLGVLGLGASAEPDHLDHPTAHASRIVGSFLLMLSVLVLECWWRHGRSSSASHGGSQVRSASATSPQASPASAAADSAMCGLEGGACFGFSAAACRTGFILAHKVSWVWVPLGLMSSVALTTSGFVLQTKGLKGGNTVVVCTLAAVSSMVSGVLVGLVALDEKMPSTHGMRVIRLSAWGCILLGVSSLAGGSDGLTAASRALAGLLCHVGLPQWAWRHIPRPAALALHKAHKKLHSHAVGSPNSSSLDGGLGLPVVEPVESVPGAMGSTGTMPLLHSSLHHTQHSSGGFNLQGLQGVVARAPSPVPGGPAGIGALDARHDA